MPEIRHYEVTQTRTVKVSANDEIAAARIADAAFTYGQNANSKVDDDHCPDVWGNTESRMRVEEISVKRV